MQQLNTTWLIKRIIGAVQNPQLSGNSDVTFPASKVPGFLFNAELFRTLIRPDGVTSSVASGSAKAVSGALLDTLGKSAARRIRGF